MQKKLFLIPDSQHGGTLHKGVRKRRRPLCKKRVVHLVLKSRKNLYARRNEIRPVLNRQAELAEVKLYDAALAHDHIHLALKIPHRRNYVKFIRALTGILARKLGKGLWSLSPWSRVVEWGKPFQIIKNYFALNRAEASGEIPYQPRKKRREPA